MPDFIFRPTLHIKCDFDVRSDDPATPEKQPESANDRERIVCIQALYPAQLYVEDCLRNDDRVMYFVKRHWRALLQPKKQPSEWEPIEFVRTCGAITENMMEFECPTRLSLLQQRQIQQSRSLSDISDTLLAYDQSKPVLILWMQSTEIPPVKSAGDDDVEEQKQHSKKRTASVSESEAKKAAKIAE